MPLLELDYVEYLSLVDEPAVEDSKRYLVTKRHEPNTEAPTERIEKKSVAGVSFNCTRSGKLDESEIDKEETDLGSHYLYGSGDDKSDYSYPVVGADGCLYRGNVDSAWSLGCRGQCNNADAHDEKLKALGMEFGDNPIPSDAYEKRASATDERAESRRGTDSVPMNQDELEDRLEEQHEQTVKAATEAATEAASEAVGKALADDDDPEDDDEDVVKRLVDELEAQDVIKSDDGEADEEPETDIEKRLDAIEKALQNPGRRGIGTQATAGDEGGFSDTFAADAASGGDN